MQAITIKYGIASKESFRQWVLECNANKELKDYVPKREIYMAEAKKRY